MAPYWLCHCWMMGSSVAVSICWTISMYTRAGVSITVHTDNFNSVYLGLVTRQLGQLLLVLPEWWSSAEALWSRSLWTTSKHQSLIYFYYMFCIGYRIVLWHTRKSVSTTSVESVWIWRKSCDPYWKCWFCRICISTRDIVSHSFYRGHSPSPMYSDRTLIWSHAYLPCAILRSC